MGAPHPPPPMVQMAPPPIPQGTPFVIQMPIKVIPPHAIVLVQTTGAFDDRIQRIEQMLKKLRVIEGMDVWDGSDSAPVTPLPPKFRMSYMERYTGRGCPRTHLRIYS